MSIPQSRGFTRQPQTQVFIDALQAAFAQSDEKPVAQSCFTETLFNRLATPGQPGTAEPELLPVCQNLGAACAAAQSAHSAVAELARALDGLIGRLAWKTRASGGPFASDNWWAGHANAVVIGRGGVEDRDDVAIGLSLLAPHVRYPDHTHPPEELYMVLTEGRFQHGEDPWVDLGPGAAFHNPPAIKHAMASGEAPLLAIWTMIIG